MRKKSLSKNFERIYENISVIPQERDEEEMLFFLNLIAKDNKRKVLDLGCAEGKFSILLALNGYEVTASDISTKFLTQLNRMASKQNLNIKTIKCDIEKSVKQFKGEKFEVIYFTDVIEHLRNVPVGLENIRTILKDDGILIIHTPNVLTIGRFLSAIFRRRQLINYYNPQNLGDLHFSTFDYKTLEKTLNFQGFKVEEIIPTKLSFPKMGETKFLQGFYKLLAKQFPLLSDTLLLKCKKTEPIDFEKTIKYWEKKYNKSTK